MTKDDAWKHYQIHADIYMNHLELVLKLNLFYYAITGAILSFYMSNRLPRLILVFPFLMSVGIAVFAFYGLVLVRRMQRELELVRSALNMPNEPQFGALKGALLVSGVLISAIAVALLSLLTGFAPELAATPVGPKP
jgi:hypothetical protein